MATHANSTTAPAVLLSEAELLALFDRGAGIDQLVERLIDILDATDAPSEDLEDGNDAELDSEGEATLGAPEQHHNQNKWGRTLVDGDGELELSLGAPERFTQVQWAAGSRSVERDEGESEPGYDLPEGDGEWDGEGEDAKPSLGATNNHHNQTEWGQGSGSDAELVNEDGIARQSDGLDLRDLQANQVAARDLARRAEALRRRKERHDIVTRDPDEIRPGNLRLIGGQLVKLVGVVR